MAKEFVDLYEVLELPVEADRNTLRRRVNELYLEAQRNLDHRHFATKIKFQELFEVTLPQARYILLDDGRRDEYNRVVRAFRAAKEGGPPVPAHLKSRSAALASSASGDDDFGLTDAESNANLPLLVGRAPVVEALPERPLDLAQVAREREELWEKWKLGLEAALSAEGGKPKSRAAITSAPTSFSNMTFSLEDDEALPSMVSAYAPLVTAPLVTAPLVTAPIATAPIVSAPRAGVATAERPSLVSLDSNRFQNGGLQTGSELIVSTSEIEARRAEHRRQLMKGVLVNAGLFWGIAGAALILVPGLGALAAASSHYYPHDAAPVLGFSSRVLWGVALLVTGVAAFFTSRALSNLMRRRKAMQLSFLSDEELLQQIGKS